jgi:PEGA domain
MSLSLSDRAMPRLAICLAALLLCAGPTGCVERRLMVRSSPPGALVRVDGYEIGTTPVATPFIYYGTREIQLVKDGYETMTVKQPIPAPWYQFPPLDFISENLVPGEIRDERVVDYQLVPQRVVPTEQLLNRADDLRRGGRTPQ